MIYKTLHKKIKIEQQQPLLKSGVNSCALEGLPVPAPHVVLFVLLFLPIR